MTQTKLFPEPKPTSVQGEVVRIVFANEDNGFHIVRIHLIDRTQASQHHVGKDGLLTIKVTHFNMAEGVTYKFDGQFHIDPTFGHQFIASSATEVLPSTKEGLISYLSSSHFHGIGQVKARKIVRHFGDDTLNVFNNDIDRLLEVTGITEANLENIKKGWEENKEVNEVMQFLMEHRISAALAGKIYAHYGKNCVAQIQEDPYDLARSMKGIGFKKSDVIALSLGFAEDSPLRIKACIRHVLESSENNGHCFLYGHQILSGTEEFLGFNVNLHVEDMLSELEECGDIVVLRSLGEDERFYSARLYKNEMLCYDRVKEMSQQQEVEINEEELLEEIKRGVGIDLSEQQKQAVIGILKSKGSVLTGGPGTGKTSVTKALVQALEYIGISYLLCAPTGRAARRMSDVIGRPASTIHRMLVWDPVNGGFAHGTNLPLDTECVIVDEFSMVDIHLAASLLRAIKKDTMVVFIGDPDQLPPVGAGNFFRDLIDSKVIPTFVLTQIFRQGVGSSITDFSHAINNGEVPDIDSPLEDPKIWTEKGNGKDCLFIDSGFHDISASAKDYPSSSSLRYGYDVMGMIEKVYKDTIPKYHNHPKDIQVLIPMKRGSLGTIEVNKRLQESLNPSKGKLKEIKVIDKVFRENDKVIQLVNNYDLGVSNGDVGRIVAIDHHNSKVHINYGEERIVPYSKNDMLDIDLAYAITTHKSQGSEFDFVIMPIMNQYYRMLYRQLIYTGLTRAKKLAVFIGQRQSLAMAVNTPNSSMRQTSLKELLLESVASQEQA